MACGTLLFRAAAPTFSTLSLKRKSELADDPDHALEEAGRVEECGFLIEICHFVGLPDAFHELTAICGQNEKHGDIVLIA